MERKEYSASAVKHLFWFSEFRRVVQLLDEGYSLEDVRQKNRAENLFGSPTQRRATQIFNVVAARIQSLDPSFYPVFMRSELSSQKLFALIAAMAYDTLFFDLVYEVVREKIMIGSNELHDSDLRIFLSGKQQQDAKAAKWTPETCAKLCVVYKSMLYDAGLTDKAKGTRTIHVPILEFELEDWLRANGLSVMIEALTGVQ